jgi:hypothetical protein
MVVKSMEENKKKFSFKLKKTDIVGLAVLVAFVALMAMMVYAPKDSCEVARPNYQCASLKDVMIENCGYWGKYGCETSADISLPDIEWYIGNLCQLQNSYHSTGLDCSNLKQACNQITGNLTCP